jgi:hypothetical protein
MWLLHDGSIRECSGSAPTRKRYEAAAYAIRFLVFGPTQSESVLCEATPAGEAESEAYGSEPVDRKSRIVLVYRATAGSVRNAGSRCIHLSVRGVAQTLHENPCFSARREWHLNRLRRAWVRRELCTTVFRVSARYGRENPFCSKPLLRHRLRCGLARPPEDRCYVRRRVRRLRRLVLSFVLVRTPPFAFSPVSMQERFYPES